MTFIFYDTETTGLNAAFDQVVQFAAIVTDDDFGVLEELDLRCRLRPHQIASPGAMRVTRVGPKAIQSAPMSCYAMTGQIRAFIERHTPAVLVGFNSISFDENMLRQMFFQGLHPTYLTNTNGNSRMDVMRLAHAVAEHKPDAIRVPLNEKGKPSFRLGHLIEAKWLERYALLARFDDRRFQEFGERLIYADFPEGLPPERLTALKAWHRDRYLTEGDVPWLTLTKARAEFDEVKDQLTAEDALLAVEMGEYLTGLMQAA